MGWKKTPWVDGEAVTQGNPSELFRRNASPQPNPLQAQWWLVS
jgi:hypothetical protein